MARIFITGSSDGLGQLAARQLVGEGHQVVLHARNKARGQEAMDSVPGAEAVLTADLSSIGETKQLANDVNALGAFGAVIHNAGVYQAPGELIVAVNVLAPYILTSLMHRPKRLIYLGSGLHTGGHVKLNQLADKPGEITYSDSKLYILMLTMAVARLWPEVCANVVNPGWVPTKMGGASASDDLEKGYQTQAWLATSSEAEAQVSGRYFYHKEQKSTAPEVGAIGMQDELLALCETLTACTIH